MIRRSDVTVSRVVDGLGIPEAGVYITVRNADGDIATLFDDDGSLLDNPLVSGADGAFHYNIADEDQGTYFEEYRLSPLATARKVWAIGLGTDISAAVLAVQDEIETDAAQIAQYVGDAVQQIAAATDLFAAVNAAPASGLSISAANRTVLAALGTDRPAVLMESGREGVFVFDSSNLSAKVTADPYQAIYVAPASDTTGASGAWVRDLPTSEVKAEWAGIVYDDNTGTVPADNLARLTSLCEMIISTGRPYSRIVLLAPGTVCYISGTLEPRAQFYLKGYSDGRYTSHLGGSGGASSRLIAPINTTVIRVCGPLTSGETSTPGGDFTQNAGGSTIEGLGIEQVTQGTDLTAHGIRLRAPANIINCVFDHIAGDARHIRASVGGTGSDFGNANGWFGFRNTVHTCGGNALFIQGSDVNAGLDIDLITHGPAVTGVGGCGILDNSYIGCTHVNPQITGYGNTGVSYGGNLYRLVDIEPGIGASTTPGTNSAIWWPVGAGAPSSTFPAWSGSGTYYVTLPIYCETGASTLVGGYQEGSAICVWSGRLDSTAFLRIPSGMATEHFGSVIIGGNDQGSLDGRYLHVKNTTGYGFYVDNTTSSQFINNWNIGLALYGADMNYKTGRSHRFYTGSGIGVASAALTVTIDTTGVDVVGFVNASVSYKVAGTKVVGARETGWTTGTGTANKGAFAAYAGGTRSASYVQAEAQATDDAAKAASQRIKAIEDALRTHGLIS